MHRNTVQQPLGSGLPMQTAKSMLKLVVTRGPACPKQTMHALIPLGAAPRRREEARALTPAMKST